MLAKPKPFPLPPRLARSPLVQNPLTVLAVNWLCQGVRGMGRRERTARLLGELAVAGLCAPPLTLVLPPAPALLAAFALAHTLAWTLNGQFWVAMRYLPCWRRDPAAVTRFAAWLTRRLAASPWLREAVLVGSLARRGTPTAGSDIDLRLVYPAGFRARLRADGLAFLLRLRAFFAAVPLDLYLEDRVEDLARLDAREPWRVLLDRDGRIRRIFARSRTLVGPGR